MEIEITDKERIILEKLVNLELDAILSLPHLDREYFEEVRQLKVKIIGW